MSIHTNALEQIYRERKDDLVKYARARLRNPDTAEEIVQDAFVHTLDNPHGRTVFNFTYLRGVVRRLCANANSAGHDSRVHLPYEDEWGLEHDEGAGMGKAPAGGGYRTLPKPPAE